MKTSSLRKLLCILVCMMPGFCLFSQKGPGETGAAAAEEPAHGPSVSDFRAEVRENLVRLSWRDAPGARGPVHIYRSFAPFDKNHLPPRLAAVPWGTESFIDEIDSSGTVYYFAAASGEDGRPPAVFVPEGNVLSVSVSVIPETAPAVSGGPEITGIEARVEGESVIVNCRIPEESKGTILYRSVEPVRRTADLLSAVIVRAGAVFPFADYPVPGIPCYYTVIYEEELVRGSVRIQPGRNSTATAVEIPSAAEGKDLRSLPLPLLSIQNTVPGADRFSELPAVIPLRPDAAKAVAEIRAGTPPERAEKKPRAFSEDLEITAEGGDAPLRGIVQGPFLKREWEQAREDLLRFLLLPRTAAEEARAHFYLGQTGYFTGRYREALIEFLLFQKEYPLEAGEWLEAVLDRMTQTRQPADG
ncbi:MAG: tetratricopeptide repeat protein [Treponema sp.]|jgi:hypothetical protein|nr:tetratricopeptide repeat protein [Treponema sp.]